MLRLNIATVTPVRMEWLTVGLDHSAAAVKLARRRAMRRTITYAESLIKKSLSAQTGIPQKAFKPRIKREMKDDGAEGIIWVGTYRVSAHGIGNVRQTATGVRAGSFFFRGAFDLRSVTVGKSAGGPGYKIKPGVTTSKKTKKQHKKQVWIRTGSKHYDPSRYTVNPFGSGPGFPVAAVSVDIQAAAEEAVLLSENDIIDRFETAFQQELNYALNLE